jgi:hypothetical protein
VSASRPCPEWSGDLAALALGQLDGAEAARVRAHAEGCPGCRDARRELERTAALLSLVDPADLVLEPAPPPDLADRILRQVRDERRAALRRRRRRVLGVVAAAAAVVALVAGTAGILATRGGGDDLREFATETPGVDAAFELRGNSEGTSVLLAHKGLDPEDVYWLWLTDDAGVRVSAGTFHGSRERSEVTLQSALGVDDAVRIWVTDEHDEVVLDTVL